MSSDPLGAWMEPMGYPRFTTFLAPAGPIQLAGRNTLAPYGSEMETPLETIRRIQNDNDGTHAAPRCPQRGLEQPRMRPQAG